MKHYETLQKKYNLPKYDELNTNFDIEDIDDTSKLILAKIRLKMHEKLEFHAELIEEILQSNSDLSTLYEAKYLSEKTNLYSLFKKLMHLLRKSSLAAVNNTEAENAQYIIYSFNAWQNLKPKIEALLNNLSEAWKKETDIKEDMSYFG